MPPANAGQYEEPCDHDFALRVEGRLYRVDVFGPRRDGTFANPGKAQVNLHLACHIEDQDVVWEAVVPGSRFNAEILPVLCISPVRMTVRLYRAEYGTFEAYCQERWGMSRRRAYQASLHLCS